MKGREDNFSRLFFGAEINLKINSIPVLFKSLIFSTLAKLFDLQNNRVKKI